MSYDIWKTNAPEPSLYPLRCTECGEHVYKDVEDRVGDPHCVCTPDECDPCELPGRVHGVLEYDEGYDFAYDDPRIP